MNALGKLPPRRQRTGFERPIDRRGQSSLHPCCPVNIHADRSIDRRLAWSPARSPPPHTHPHPPTIFLLQIRFLLLQNRQGKTRLSKWYVPPPNEQEKFRMEAEIHKIIVSRDRKYTNFVEVRMCVCVCVVGGFRAVRVQDNPSFPYRQSLPTPT
jgi:hypothetical protein